MMELIHQAIQQHRKQLKQFEAEQLDRLSAAAGLLTECLVRGGCIFLCGNGGSAADAQHIAGELVGRFLRNRKAVPAVALTTDTSVLTAIGNDFSYDAIFERQVQALVKPGDCLWAFSTSGTSKNILAAARLARQQGAKILAFTGRKDSALENLSDVTIVADAPTSAAAQEIHQLAYHILCDLIERRCCD